MTQATATSLYSQPQDMETPYQRSWIDRLIEAIERTPGPSSLFYVVALLALALLNHAVFWLDGSLAAGSFDAIKLADALYIVYFVALYHHLSRVAKQSFQVFQPMLGSDDSDLRILEYRLTTLPGGLGWLAILLGLGFAIFFIQLEPADFGLDTALTLLPVIYLYAFLVVLFSSVFSLIFQTTRQLMLVNRLHRQATDINLFKLAPAHAFACLTARAGIGLVLIIVLNGLSNPSGVSDVDPFSLFSNVAVGVAAVITFSVPLLSMHSRLTEEKARLLNETNEAIQLTIGRIHEQVNSNEYEAMSGLNTAMGALSAERNLLESIPTWPWNPSTLRGFASTLLLPIFIWLVTVFLGRLI